MNQDITHKQYVFISELLWGCVPIDKSWAINTKLFQQEAQNILDKYPKLIV